MEVGAKIMLWCLQDAAELEGLKSELRAAIVKEMALVRSQVLGAKPSVRHGSFLASRVAGHSKLSMEPMAMAGPAYCIDGDATKRKKFFLST